MFSRATISNGILLAFLTAACSSGSSPEPAPAPGGSGGSGGQPAGAGGYGTGGAQGGAGGSGGSAPGGQGGGGSGGSGGSPAVDAGGGGSGGAPVADASPPSGGDAGGTPISPPAAGQGPVGEGKVVFNQDFEQNMDGMSRSPGNLPADRIQIVDDPIGKRGKVVRIHYEMGDNFRTSPGTEPRSWFSSAQGYTIKPGTTVSIAFGFMLETIDMNAHFAQIIRSGGPLWMFGIANDGSMSAEVHRGSGGGKAPVKLEAMKWYDFRIDTTYTGGGEMKFFLNGQQFATGKGDGGADARFDCGIYWNHNAKPSRTVFISNVSIAEK
jgi:hypothetical protein